jgi:hypothetical protein
MLAGEHLLGRGYFMDWVKVAGDFFGLSSIDWELLVRMLIQCCLFSMSAFFSGPKQRFFAQPDRSAETAQFAQSSFREHPRHARRAAASDRLAALRQRTG